MNKGIIYLKDTEVGKRIFHPYKNPFILEDVDNENTFMCKKTSFCKNGLKHFIGSKDNDKKVRPLCLVFSKVKSYKKNWWN